MHCVTITCNDLLLLSPTKPRVPYILLSLTDTVVHPGFAFMHPDNSCSVNAVEAIPLGELDIDAARAGLAKYEVGILGRCALWDAWFLVV